MSSMNSIDRCTDYAHDVLAGRILAGKDVKLACKRHLRDLERQGTDEFPWVFDLDEADRIIRFGEKLVFTDGYMRNRPVELVPFQCFIMGSLFGWVHKDTRYLRFNKSYVQLARKQAKSLLNAIIAIYVAEFKKSYNGQIYTAATKRDQAKIVWTQIKKFIDAKPNLKRRFKHYEREGISKSLKFGSKIVSLGRDTNSIDGFECLLGIVDEYHSHKNNQMVKLLQDSAINLPEFLISIITTAGFDVSPTHPCIIEYDYSRAILNETMTNERYFAYIAQLDKGDDPFDPNNWEKCAPLMPYIPQAKENMITLMLEAIAKQGEELRNFFTKTLNVWYEWSDNTYLTIEEIRQCASDVTIDDMQGKTCAVGIDLAAVDDLCAIGLEFELEDGTTFLHTHGFIPEDSMYKRIKNNSIPYSEWVDKGLVTPTPGIKTDYNFVVQYLVELRAKYNLVFLGIGYDRHGIDTILPELGQFGCDTVDIAQSAKVLHDPTESLAVDFRSKKVSYNRRDQLFEFCFSNAVLTYNSFKECKIDKLKQKNKIDVADAVINARKISMTIRPKITLSKVLNRFNKLYDNM